MSPQPDPPSTPISPKTTGAGVGGAAGGGIAGALIILINAFFKAKTGSPLGDDVEAALQILLPTILGGASAFFAAYIRPHFKEP